MIGNYKFILIDNNKNTLQFLVKGNTDRLMKVELNKESDQIELLIIDNERNYTPKCLTFVVLNGICHFCEVTRREIK